MSLVNIAMPAGCVVGTMAASVLPIVAAVIPARSVWISDEKMKMRWPHQLPLSRQVLYRHDEVCPLAGHSPYVFPATHAWKRPMSGDTVNGGALLNGMGLWKPDAIER